MQGDLGTKAVQVGEPPDTSVERFANSEKIYTVRKDCMALKTRLLEVVTEPDYYWVTLACFLHGQCSRQTFEEAMQNCLKTAAAKVMHNELIRSIVYNAHFAMLPPPNMPPPKLECAVPAKRATPTVVTGPSASFMTYTASDLRHLPNMGQLAARVEILLGARRIAADPKALPLVFGHMKRYIMLILESSADLLAVQRVEERTDVRITTAQVLHVLQTRGELASTVSPAMLTKYARA